MTIIANYSLAQWLCSLKPIRCDLSRWNLCRPLFLPFADKVWMQKQKIKYSKNLIVFQLKLEHSITVKGPVNDIYNQEKNINIHITILILTWMIKLLISWNRWVLSHRKMLCKLHFKNQIPWLLGQCRSPGADEVTNSSYVKCVTREHIKICNSCLLESCSFILLIDTYPG